MDCSWERFRGWVVGKQRFGWEMQGAPCCRGPVGDLAAPRGGIGRRTQATCGGVLRTGVGGNAA